MRILFLFFLTKNNTETHNLRLSEKYKNDHQGFRMVQTVNVMIGKIQSLAVSEGCAVRHLYNCNDLEQATQGQRASIYTGSFIRRPHTVASLHPHTH